MAQFPIFIKKVKLDIVWQKYRLFDASMKNRLNVKTFAVGFAVGTGNRGNYDSLADNGGTDAALYANSAGQLLTALTDAVSYTHLTLPTNA